MKGFFKLIRNLIIIITLLVIGSTAFDYLRMSGGQLPIFNISNYNENTKVQSFNGLIYQAKRQVKASPNESLIDSKNISFMIFNYDLKVPSQYRDINSTISLETTEKSKCNESSILYYADNNIKIYTYCLEDIRVKDNNKSNSLKEIIKSNNRIIDEIDKSLAFTGIANDHSTLMFQNRDDDFTNLGLTMYRCNKVNINDVYFAPKNTPMKDDFCTYKDDDFKYIFEIVDETPEGNNDTEGEIIYEDNDKLYKLTSTKSEYIFIKTPKVRGKDETKKNLKEVLDNHLLTINELIEKGLSVEEINKTEEEK